MATIGERIKEIRKEHKLTLDQLGEIAGVSKQFLSLVENGKKEPGKDTLRTICDYFNVDMDYVIGRSDVKNALNFEGIYEKGVEHGRHEAIKEIKTLNVMSNVINVPDYVIGRSDVKNALNFEGIYEKGVEHGRHEAIKEIKTLNVMSNVINVPIYSSLSCGAGTWVDEIPEDFISIPESMMFHGQAFANFAEGDSMEPNIKSGDLLVFQECPQIQSGYIGSFSLNDAYYCKRFKQLPDGSYWLFSDNSNYDPIPITKNDDFRVLGIYKLKISKEQ